jgi:hypothetical protein
MTHPVYLARNMTSPTAAPIALLLLLAAAPARAGVPAEVGWLEPLVFPDAQLRLTAKLDTGAKTSALDAEKIEFFERDGERWARFQIRRRRGSDDVRTFEARVVRDRSIRSANGREVRPVVDLWVCLAGQRRRVLFTLGNRSHMNYRVILGRRALEGRLAVDAARKFTTEPGCPSEDR